MFAEAERLCYPCHRWQLKLGICSEQYKVQREQAALALVKLLMTHNVGSLNVHPWYSRMTVQMGQMPIMSKL